MSDDRMAAKVAKLLRLAEHPNTPEAERLNASAQAAALMEKFAIDEIMLARTKSGQEPPTEKIVQVQIRTMGTYMRADTNLAHLLSQAMGMKSIYSQLHQTSAIIYVIGFESDQDRFRMFFDSCKVQRQAALAQYIDRIDAWPLLSGAEKSKTRRSFLLGYGRGFCERLAEVHRKVEQEAAADHGTGTALVLADRKGLVQAQYNQLHPKVKQTRGLSVNGSYGSGVDAGRRGDVGQSKVGTGR